MKINPNSYFKAGLVTLMFPSILLLSCAYVPESFAERKHASTTINTDNPVDEKLAPPDSTSRKKKIKIALLLDTSGSMDGLIDQAKAQLWKLVNELSTATCEGKKPDLEIALYEYGNDGLPSEEGYIRQISKFTNDLDLISEQLFSLTTNGGSEFCGRVIHASLSQLNWSGDDGDLKIIFIAGNEPFTQGDISYTRACSGAKQKEVVVNTIYCGRFEEGLMTGWKNGAVLTGGEYMSIEQDRKTTYIESPYDAEILKLNDKINDTYITYGPEGYARKSKQLTQDKNAAQYGIANQTNRTIAKSSSFYSNSSWDMVDASESQEFDIATIKDSDLPAELKGKTKAEKKNYIALKKHEREQIKLKIASLNKQRLKYISEKENGKESSLDAAMLKSIKEQAIKKKFTFES